MADPGFPIGGGTNLQHICFLAKTYVKTKEWILLGGVWQWHPPGSANDLCTKLALCTLKNIAISNNKLNKYFSRYLNNFYEKIPLLKHQYRYLLSDV